MRLLVCLLVCLSLPLAACAPGDPVPPPLEPQITPIPWPPGAAPTPSPKSGREKQP